MKKKNRENDKEKQWQTGSMGERKEGGKHHYSHRETTVKMSSRILGLRKETKAHGPHLSPETRPPYREACACDGDFGLGQR